MSELKSIQNWFDFNAVARQGYLATLAKLPPSELKRDRGASFPTVIDIFGHSMGGIETWIVRMSALNGEPFSHFEGPDDMSVEDLRRYDRWIQERVAEFFSRLKEEDLDRSYLVPKMPPWWDEDFTTTIRGTLLHIVEHELQHRGELNALLWQIDVEPPILDWDEFEKIRAQRSNAKP
jgi:uncharacterized damage-inducible protein DinB